MNRQQRRALHRLLPEALDRLAAYECPDCDNDAELWLDTAGAVHLKVLHDDTCPWLAARIEGPL